MANKWVQVIRARALKILCTPRIRGLIPGHDRGVYDGWTCSYNKPTHAAFFPDSNTPIWATVLMALAQRPNLDPGNITLYMELLDGAGAFVFEMLHLPTYHAREQQAQRELDAWMMKDNKLGRSQLLIDLSPLSSLPTVS